MIFISSEGGSGVAKRSGAMIFVRCARGILKIAVVTRVRAVFKQEGEVKQGDKWQVSTLSKLFGLSSTRWVPLLLNSDVDRDRAVYEAQY